MTRSRTRFWKRLGLVLGGAVVALWLANTNAFAPAGLPEHTKLLAHRGVHQFYVGHDRSASSCQAAPIAPVTHNFIENTLPSMAEAFRLGAEVVELDVHLTPDGAFAVFHDWTLDCRTDGTGVTHKQTLETLRALDLAYNLDDGSGTFPLRGRHVGALPTLQEVFEAHFGGRYLINFKTAQAAPGAVLADRLNDWQAHDQVYGIYGGGPPTAATLAATPGLRGFDKAGVRDCLLSYAATGWSGRVPAPCRDTLIMVPQNVGPWLWGWPHRFAARMKTAGTDVILVGDYDGSGFSSGIDTAADFARVPTGFSGYVWTNRIEVLGPLNAARQAP